MVQIHDILLKLVCFFHHLLQVLVTQRLFPVGGQFPCRRDNVPNLSPVEFSPRQFVDVQADLGRVDHDAARCRRCTVRAGKEGGAAVLLVEAIDEVPPDLLTLPLIDFVVLEAELDSGAEGLVEDPDAVRS